jgi:hypothetical protein
MRADEKLTAFLELETVATTRARTFTGLSRIILRSNRQAGPGIPTLTDSNAGPPLRISPNLEDSSKLHSGNSGEG